LALFKPSTTCKTFGGPDPYRQCIFPFTWNGQTYYGCPVDPENNSYRWCSTKVDGYGNHVTGQGRYGYCDNSCPSHSSPSYNNRPINNYRPSNNRPLYNNRPTNNNGFSITNGQSKPPIYIDGRPFVVEGNIRSAISLRCDIVDCPVATSWSSGGIPSFLDNSTISSTIGLEWLQQAEAEHASIASFARHTLQLMSIGAPSNLIMRSQQASIDEIEHAKMCYGFASEFMETKIYPGLLDVDGSLEKTDMNVIIESVIRDGCIQETISAIEGHFRAHHATDEVIKSSLTKLAADETKHAQLAWDTIKWIVDQYPEYETVVNKIFVKELKKQEKLANNESGYASSPLCSDPTLESMSTRYGIISKDDKEMVRIMGLNKIIKSTYHAGFDDYSLISDRIIELNYNIH